MHSLTDIQNYLPLWGNVATSGQPEAEQFIAVTEAGFEVVVNLLPEAQMIPGERDFFESAGLEFIHIPVLWTEPTLDEFEQFAVVLERRREKRIYIHCAANMRASVFCYLYRTLYLGVATEDAQADLQRIWTPNPIWQRFLSTVEKHYRKPSVP